MKVILDGDIATGYNDFIGNPVAGTVQATGTKKSEGKSIAVTGCNVHFPYHQQGPSTYGTIDLTVTGTGKMKIAGVRVVLEGTVLSNGATLVASGSKLISS